MLDVGFCSSAYSLLMILSLKMNFSIHTKMIENYLDLAGDM
jgi:hypothetical protein